MSEVEWGKVGMLCMYVCRIGVLVTNRNFFGEVWRDRIRGWRRRRRRDPDPEVARGQSRAGAGAGRAEMIDSFRGNEFRVREEKRGILNDNDDRSFMTALSG